MKCMVASSVALALAFAGMQVSAQVRQDRVQRPDQPRAEVERTQRGVDSGIEAKLAGWLATCNQVEIEVSQLAAQKASDPAVKQFAQEMVEAHTQLNAQLAQFLPPGERRLQTRAAGSADRAGTPGQSDLRRPAGAQRETDLADAQRETNLNDRTQTPAQRAGGDPLQEIAATAARKSAEMTTSLLGEKQGKEFDMCYSGWQVFAHINFVSELEAMEGHGSEQFQQVVMKATQATKGHLEEAKQLAEKIGSSTDPAERVTRRPEQQGRQPQDDQRP